MIAWKCRYVATACVNTVSNRVYTCKFDKRIYALSNSRDIQFMKGPKACLKLQA